MAGNEGPPSDPLDVTWDSTPPPAPTRPARAPRRPAPPRRLSWTSGGAASDFDHYDVYRGRRALGATAGTTCDGHDGWLVSGSYSYTVKAIDALGNASAASAPARVVMYDVTAPGAPSSLTIRHADERSPC